MLTWKTDATAVPLHSVLIISDQRENVAAWAPLFTHRSCIVLSESRVSDALQSARLVGPSLMLVDMDLSKAERMSLLAGLHAASRGPILMLINANTLDEIVEANHEGADECLVKPVRPAVLVVKALAWLSHGQRSERAPVLQNITA
jgi:DNA-binding response OmpR family regulator